MKVRKEFRPLHALPRCRAGAVAHPRSAGDSTGRRIAGSARLGRSDPRLRLHMNQAPIVEPLGLALGLLAVSVDGDAGRECDLVASRDPSGQTDVLELFLGDRVLVSVKG